MTTRAFRTNPDGFAIFYLLNSSQNGFQAFSGIAAVKKKAIKTLHPVTKEGNGTDFLFGDKAGYSPNLGIGDNNIKIAAVIAGIEHSLIRMGEIFLSLDGDVNAGEEKENKEQSFDQIENAFVSELRIKLSDDPFHQKNRDAKGDKKEDKKENIQN